MARKRKPRRPAHSVPPVQAPPKTPRPATPRRVWLLAAGLVVVLALAGGLAYFGGQRTPAPPPAAEISPPAASAPAPEARYVGVAGCAECHPREHDAWRGSQHDRAMAEANAETVLGNFDNAKFTHAGVTSTFFKRDGKFFVRTDGPDGKLADFEVRYTFGVYPLQQYLVPFPGGRFQALGIAWDARPREQGGQRWFHLYPDRKLKAGDPLHWTGIDQVWNYQCADCHSTNLRKNYDEKADRYETAWTDINVTCEACHGPGSNHVAWARKEGDWKGRDDPRKGLTVALDERSGVSWAIDPATGNAARSRPRASAREIEACARCHARRGQFSDAWHAGDALGDGYRVSLLEPGLYYDDGQMRDEVYNFGSFIQSRMYAKGVTCSDCHDPHTQKLRATAGAVCGQCHAPVRYATASHHHHAEGSRGAECVSCHMPATTYMVVDPRHDHRFGIPRPDRSVSLGVPNACNRCHGDRKPEWAADAVAEWYPHPKPGFQTFAETFAAADRGAPGAKAELMRIAGDAAQSGLARASAVQRLASYLDPVTLRTVENALRDPGTLLRAAAVGALAGTDAVTRQRLLPPLLADPVREVRMEAAAALAGEPEAGLAPEDRARFRTALDEYIAAQRFDSDRPEGRANLGALYARQGRFDEAAAQYQSALALDPTYVPAAVNLADVYRARGNEADAERTLLEALKRDPRAAAAHYALGLSLVRQKRSAEALKELADANRLAPDTPRFAYVYAVALNDAGQKQQAIRVLEAALERRPNDRDLLLGAALFLRDGGEARRAGAYARRLAELEPDNPQVQQLSRELDSSGR